MINLRKTLELAKTLLTKSQIDFALIGGFALGAHGLHRATKDIDLLVDGAHRDTVKRLFTESGFIVNFNSTEVLQMSGPGYLDIVFANRPLSLEMIQTAKSGIKLGGVPVIDRESLIGLKIQAYKNDPSRILQDKADIQAILRQGNLDKIKIKKFADLFDAWPEIEELEN